MSIVSGLSLLCVATTSPAPAQPVLPDGTTQTTLSGDCAGNCTITGETRGGNNLFHSFSRFNVDPGATVLFNSPADVTNIFSRVTGSNISNIDGTLGVSGSDANLFLMNPNGIIFGPNASLDLTGSFVATTANAIRLGDLGSFSTTPAGENLSTLTLNPSALLFNQYDALAAISTAQAANPNDPSVQEDFFSLLSQVGLSNVVEQERQRLGTQ